MYEVDLREINFHNYDELIKKFKWNIPSNFNIGEAILDRKIKDGLGDNAAIYYEDDEGNHSFYTFAQLKSLSDSLITTLKEIGLKRGDVIGIYLQPRVETIASILSAYRMGAISLSISPLMGVDAVEYRIKHSEAKVIIMEGSKKEVREKLKNVIKIVVEGEATGENEFEFDNIKKVSGVHNAVNSESNEPAHLFYTSGTTGPPKGVLHAHRFLLGHIPAYQLYFEMAPKENDVFYPLADWGWIGALGDVILPSLYFGKPIVAYRTQGVLSSADILAIMEKYKVTCAFIPPSTLRAIKREVNNIRGNYNLNIRAISSAGESVGQDMIDWATRELTPNINEFYGSTEANLVLVNNSMWRKVGSLGKPAPGHEVAVIDENGNKLINQIGSLAIKIEDDPVVFLGYYKNPEATAKKIKGPWFLYGDLALMDQDGYIWFKGREDDVIKISEQIIIPEEIERSVLLHPAVKDAAAIGKNKLGKTVIVIFLVLKEGYSLSNELMAEIKQLARNKLPSSLKEIELEIEVLKELPRTETSKLKRVELRKREEK